MFRRLDAAMTITRHEYEARSRVAEAIHKRFDFIKQLSKI
jgi:hypothetical protein